MQENVSLAVVNNEEARRTDLLALLRHLESMHGVSAASSREMGKYFLGRLVAMLGAKGGAVAAT